MTASTRVPPEQHAARMRDRIRAAGLHLERFGCGWRVHGRGIDVLVAGLDHLIAIDLMPHSLRRPGRLKDHDD